MPDAAAQRTRFAELRRHQWLDFREQNPEGLYDFLRAAVTPWLGDRGAVTVPVDIDRPT